MTSTLIRRVRGIGGMAGAIVAVAGGLGAAVGLYSMPVPQHVAIDSETYLRARQRAVAVSTIGDCGVECTRLRIEVSRGATAVAGVHDSTDTLPWGGGFHSVAVEVTAELIRCGDDYCETDQSWEDLATGEQFVFDPLMEAASFSGEVAGCSFDVVWHPAGPIAPFEGHQIGTDSWIGPENGRIAAGAPAYAETSRVAPADIQMSGWNCFDHSALNTPGYLSQGASGPCCGSRVNWWSDHA